MLKNKFLMIISIFSFIFIIIGATFSYFSISVKSDEDAVGLSSAVIGTDVVISALYNEHNIIPLNDSDVMKAYNNRCIDELGYGACYVYNIDITNNGDELGYSGTIQFDVDNISRLSYLVLDEDNNVFVDVTRVVSGTNQTLGDSFTVPSNGERHFKLVIWLTNIDDIQNDDDQGTFNATVTYDTTYGSKITGTFSVSNG